MDRRLSTIASQIENGIGLADVGTDHGFLPVHLARHGYTGNLYASDINEGPLRTAVDNAEHAGVSGRIKFLLCDGLRLCPPDDVDTIVIAGMGGELIIRIIREGGEKGTKRLILQPMTGIEKVRAFLWQSGFAITDEVFPVEDGKAYCVIGAEFSGAVPDFSYADTYLGKIRPGGDGFTAWAKKICAAAKKRLRGARDAESENNILTLISECEKYGA